LGGLQWESDNLLRIGRHNTLEIVLNYASVNRRHAEVAATPQGWVVRETGNLNGTFLNGAAVDQVGAKLQLNDVIQCGSLSLQVIVLEAGEATAPAPKEDPNCIRTSGAFVRVQASAQRTWEQAVEHTASPDDQRLRQGKHFLTLLRAGHHLAHAASLNDLLKSILDDTVKVWRRSAAPSCLRTISLAS